MASTYTQPVKERARREALQRAVEVLTEGRDDARVLREDYIRGLWDYCSARLCEYGICSALDNGFLESWCGLADTTCGTRAPQDLRIAYLCGPEPENDLDALVELGVRTENVWAIEADRQTYSAALSSARERHPTLKVFHGTVDQLIELRRVPFDIVYLDFTAPLPSASQKPFRTIHALLDSQALAGLGVLIVTTSNFDHEDANAEFLTDYFYAQKWVEGAVLGAETHDGEPVTWYAEGPLLYPMERSELRQIIDVNFHDAYSAFVTQYPIMYANLIQPMFRVLRVEHARRAFLTDDRAVLGKAIERIRGGDDWLHGVLSEELLADDVDRWDGAGGEVVYEATDYPMQYFIHSLAQLDGNMGQKWTTEYRRGDNGFSRLDAINLGDLLRTATDGYLPILSENLRNAIRQITDALPDRTGGVFCDVPMAHLWIEVALNQLGFPYHVRIDDHLRFRYTAQSRPMLVDVFTVDACRAFYDWLPLMDMYAHDLSIIERQMLARICLDAIGKHRRWVVPQMYFASALVGEPTPDWGIEFADMPPRHELT